MNPILLGILTWFGTCITFLLLHSINRVYGPKIDEFTRAFPKRIQTTSVKTYLTVQTSFDLTFFQLLRILGLLLFFPGFVELIILFRIYPQLRQRPTFPKKKPSSKKTLLKLYFHEAVFELWEHLVWLYSKQYLPDIRYFLTIVKFRWVVIVAVGVISKDMLYKTIPLLDEDVSDRRRDQ